MVEYSLKGSRVWLRNNFKKTILQIVLTNRSFSQVLFQKGYYAKKTLLILWHKSNLFGLSYYDYVKMYMEVTSVLS